MALMHSELGIQLATNARAHSKPTKIEIELLSVPNDAPGLQKHVWHPPDRDKLSMIIIKQSQLA